MAISGIIANRPPTVVILPARQGDRRSQGGMANDTTMDRIKDIEPVSDQTFAVIGTPARPAKDVGPEGRVCDRDPRCFRRSARTIRGGGETRLRHRPATTFWTA